MSWDPASYFSTDYQQARLRFRAAARAAGFTVHAFAHPLPGPDGAPLYTDVARGGPPDAPGLLITTSALHGIEGFAGSAIQCADMTSRPLLKDDTLARIHVHGLNPHGFAWERRVNENNVDLNRNFLDWSSATIPGAHPLTGKINSALSPEGEWAWPVWKLAYLLLRHGLRKTQEAVTQGQYNDPNGLFYGGSGPEWSNTVWHTVMNGVAHRHGRIAHIDIHTGLGPRGNGELITTAAPDSPAYKRACLLWGGVTSTQDGSAVSSPLRGDMLGAFARVAKNHNATLTAAGLEFGTVSRLAALKALAADHWLRAQPPENIAPELSGRIRGLMQAAFNPEDDLWRKDVMTRGLSVLRQARFSLLRY